MVHGEVAWFRPAWQATRPQLSIRRTTVRQLFLLPFALAACSAETMTDAPAMTPSASAALSSSGGVEHSVTGSGLQAIAPGFAYTIEASVRSDASGQVSGQIHVRVLDLSLFGIAPYEVEEEPTCMRVVGNTAYIGAIVTKSTDPVNAPVGALAVFWVRDGGPNGADVGHEGPAWFYDPNGLICSDTPPTDALSADPITPGNFVVR
jgi:hypothetical protein